MDEKFSLLELGNNLLFNFRLHTHYEPILLIPSPTIKTVTLSYMLCQLSSKPADQKHVTKVRHVN